MDDDYTQQLLTYELKTFSEQTNLSLAVGASHRQFIAHTACQVLLNDLWIGGLRSRKNTSLKVQQMGADIYSQLCEIRTHTKQATIPIAQVSSFQGVIALRKAILDQLKLKCPHFRRCLDYTGLHFTGLLYML
jgi:transient receptor potential cation channel subfamily M protein 3